MKFFRRAALGLAVVTALVAAPRPAQAAGPYTIVAHGTAPFPATTTAWELSGCNTAIIDSPANGIESRIVDVSAFAGRNVTLSWTSVGSPAAAGLGLFWQARAYTPGCGITALASTDWNVNRGSMTMHIPAGTRWAGFSAFAGANISFHIS